MSLQGSGGWLSSKPTRFHHHCLTLVNSLKNTCYLALGSMPQAIRPSCTVLIKGSD